VHGFNTNFEDAIFRLAQIAWDAQYHGVLVAFSWPSKGQITDYDYDRESALFSRDAFLQVLDLLQTSGKVSKVYIVAHSMGKQIVVDALAQAIRTGKRISLAEVVFAAPDVDRNIFESLSAHLKDAAKGITLYVSAADKALLTSELKAGGPRAGSIPASGPLVLPGIETIDVTAVGDDMLGINHDVYSSRSVIG
jgi:esterase/lipase superfamily enzyme